MAALFRFQDRAIRANRLFVPTIRDSRVIRAKNLELRYGFINTGFWIALRHSFSPDWSSNRQLFGIALYMFPSIAADNSQSGPAASNILGQRIIESEKKVMLFLISGQCPMQMLLMRRWALWKAKGYVPKSEGHFPLTRNRPARKALFQNTPAYSLLIMDSGLPILHPRKHDVRYTPELHESVKIAIAMQTLRVMGQVGGVAIVDIGAEVVQIMQLYTVFDAMDDEAVAVKSFGPSAA